MLKHSRAVVRVALAVIGIGMAAPAPARQGDELVEMINVYRAAPGTCAGRSANPVAPLVAHPVLARFDITPGKLLDVALERAGYPVARAEAISVSGAADAAGVFAAITRKHCKALLNPDFVAAGSTRNGDTWLIVLAQPAPPVKPRILPDTRQAEQLVLAAVNAARAAARTCGKQDFAPAPPLAWSDTLARAALAHSADMAQKRYFSHNDKDGRAVSQRATQAGYRWRLIGENIAAGQDSAKEAVAGWLDSPGHCANIMNGNFTEMGSAFAISAGASGKPGRVYWTQVLGTPR